MDRGGEWTLSMYIYDRTSALGNGGGRSGM